jgi:hypothetical protein
MTGRDAPTMSVKAPPLSPETLARVRALVERRLSPEELAAGLAVPIGDEERRQTLELVAWFRRRYPTPAERSAYVRRAYRRWTKLQRS